MRLNRRGNPAFQGGSQIRRRWHPKVAGQKQFDKLKKRIGDRSGVAVAIACLAPPPFPFTMVIAAASALGYSLWRVASINFVCRAVRFSVLGMLAIKFGTAILRIAKSPAFVWSMVVFIALCLIASAFSIRHWIHSTRPGQRSRKPTVAKT
ncbi:MAG: hypothetical protein WA682_03685 [Acidobacteriaceae bacterium]